MSLAEKLEKIRSQPKLQNQQQTAVVLNAIEDTLKAQKSDFTPTAYFAALLSLLGQYINPSKGLVNREVASAVVYLLDLVTPHVPPPLLRSKFSQILTSLAPALTHHDAEAPLLRSSIGCLEALLISQDAQAWALPQSQISPRRAVAGLSALALDHRPKVRKRAQDALTKMLKALPPTPSLDHPAADMCAETALKSLQDVAEAAGKSRKHRKHVEGQHHEPGLIHALQLVKTIAAASGGWPSRKIDTLCEILLNISKSSTEYLAMAAFEVFEIIFEGMSDDLSAPKLPRLLEVISELQPSQNDTQLLPPWIAVISRGYEVSAQISPGETFQKLPDLFNMMSAFLSSPSHNIRVSASECLISLLSTCIPSSVILEPSIYDEKVLEKLARTISDLLSVKYQAAWMEVFNVLGASFDTLRWCSFPILSTAVKTVGELRGNDAFAGKKEADAVLAKALRAMGPDKVLDILPLNLLNPSPGEPGRAWLLPLMRDSVANTRLQHFRNALVPVSEAMFQRVLDHGSAEKTMEIKIFDTIVHQIWSTLPGYCDLPLDLTEAFDQSFAELLSNLLYTQTDLRFDICKGLQNLVDSNQVIAGIEGHDDLVAQSRISKAQARTNLQHLASFAGNLLAVLFNVYSQTLPQYRAPILQGINAYLSIAPAKETEETFSRVVTMLESSISAGASQNQADKPKQPNATDKMPPTSHTLMDLLITMSIYLPRESFAILFQISSLCINKRDDPQLQKKAYKLTPRLAESSVGRTALQQRNEELQQMILSSADTTTAPARRDRLAAINQIVTFLPPSDLHFIPSILSEVVIACKEVNERARRAAFDLLVLMGEKMAAGGTVRNSRVAHMGSDAPDVTANLEEYLTMVSAGLAGTTPHMVSASITALSALLFRFRAEMKEETMTDLVQTMDLFLTSANREIVRSVLGFVKVAVISLPTSLVEPRLRTLVPNLLVWSKEHKAHFRAKVKHIIERMIRRFGVEVVERYTPEDDKKLVTNIRKTKERKKRKKDAAAENVDGEKKSQGRRKGKFESEFDEALYGDSSDEEEEGSEASDDKAVGRGRRKGGDTYIIEDEEEPLDLLDKKALGNISSTRPLRQKSQVGKKTKAKTDIDGKLILRDESSDEGADMLDGADGMEPGDGSLEGGINAYVSAIRGRDAAQRGQKGKLKFSNRKDKGAADAEVEEMDVDEVELARKMKAQKGMRDGRGREGRGGKYGRKEGKGGNKPQRRGLDGQKVNGGRVVKSSTGRGKARGRMMGGGIGR